MITSLFNLFDALCRPLDLDSIPLASTEHLTAVKESIYQNVIYQLEGGDDVESRIAQKRWRSPVALVQRQTDSWSLIAVAPRPYDVIFRRFKHHECTNN